MTARYRCPWCGSFNSNVAAEVRMHVLKRHRRAIEQGFYPLETFTPPEEEIAP